MRIVLQKYLFVKKSYFHIFFVSCLTLLIKYSGSIDKYPAIRKPISKIVNLILEIFIQDLPKNDKEKLDEITETILDNLNLNYLRNCYPSTFKVISSYLFKLLYYLYSFCNFKKIEWSFLKIRNH